MNQSQNTGQFFFYAAANGRYDIQIAAPGLTTYTLFDVTLNGPGPTGPNGVPGPPGPQGPQGPPGTGGGTGVTRILCATTGSLDQAITAAYAMLPMAGGIIDCSNRTGTQTFAANPFTGVMSPVTLILPNVAINWMAPLNVPANVVIQYGGASPDVQTTSQACTTPGTAGGTCQSTVTDNFGFANRRTICSLEDTPQPQTGLPVLLKVAAVNANSFQVTIGTFNGQAAGGGTLTCWTNTRF